LAIDGGTGVTRALVLFGPPGSGKGTQAKMLTQALSYPHISTGDMLREQIKAGTAIGIMVRDLLRQGQLVSDELVNQMVADRTARSDCRVGFILDGYPRTLFQARWLERHLTELGVAPVVVHLRVDEEKLVARLTNRRQCPQCGTLYNVLLKPPIVSGRCDIEGARLVVREDDREDVIRSRFEAYRELTAPVLGFYVTTGHYFEVEASDATPDQIFEKIRGFLDVSSAGGAAK
jgi:adenylate kinase